MGDWQQLFTSHEGRIGRQRFWIGAVILAVVSIVVSLVLTPMFGASMWMAMPGTDFQVPSPEMQAAMLSRSAWFSLVLLLLMAWPGTALAVKRRHDRGSAGTEIFVFYGASAFLLVLQGMGIGYEVYEIMGNRFVGPGMLINALSFVLGIFSLYLLVVLGFLKGTEGANAFGPDPLGADA